MKIEKLKKGKKNTYLLTIDSKEILLYDDLIVKYGLLPKKEITEKKLEDIRKENNSLEAYYIAIKQITTRLRTKNELKTILEKKEYSKDVINETLILLEKEGYLNEEKYIQAYLNDAFRFSNDGPYKIKRKLIELGTSENNIETSFLRISKDDWIKKLQKLFIKKASSKHHDSKIKWQQKCETYFYNLGYPKDWIEGISKNFTWQEDTTIIKKEYEKLYRKISRKYQGEELKFQVKRKLYEKGFSKEEITNIMNEQDEFSPLA